MFCLTTLSVDQVISNMKEYYFKFSEFLDALAPMESFLADVY